MPVDLCPDSPPDHLEIAVTELLGHVVADSLERRRYQVRSRSGMDHEINFRIKRLADHIPKKLGMVDPADQGVADVQLVVAGRARHAGYHAGRRWFGIASNLIKCDRGAIRDVPLPDQRGMERRKLLRLATQVNPFGQKARQCLFNAIEGFPLKVRRRRRGRGCSPGSAPTPGSVRRRTSFPEQARPREPRPRRSAASRRPAR